MAHSYHQRNMFASVENIIKQHTVRPKTTPLIKLMSD
jgi:hypothetical protein